MSISLAAAAAVAAIIAVPGYARAQVLTEKNISIKMAHGNRGNGADRLHIARIGCRSRSRRPDARVSPGR